jgi:hypothetical protein
MSKIMSTVVRAFRGFEDFFVCTPSAERMEFNQMGEAFYEEARVRFRKMAGAWIALTVIPMTISWWEVALTIASLAVLHVTYFMLAQDKSDKGYPYLEHTDAIAMIFVPLMALLFCWIIGGLIYGLFTVPLLTMAMVGTVSLFAFLIYAYGEFVELIKRLLHRKTSGEHNNENKRRR